MSGQYEELSCPFCDKGRISCLYFPSSIRETRTGGRGIKSIRKSSDTWVIQSSCSVCGKSVAEVEKELRRKEFI